MPTYVYRCNACGVQTEIKQSIHDAPLTHCLKCNGKANRIITSAISIQFKGSGFYCNDSK
ncbi:MAG: FmdB family zinc ribbon protein [Candidatus Margulisiibacteriota bacterium]